MLRFPRDPTSAFEMVRSAYLDSEALWFYTIVDRRERAIFCTANRHYLALDEPGKAVEPGLDALLCRWEADDPDLLFVPRMPNDERARHMAAFVASIADPTVRSELDQKRTWVLTHWDDAWRPGSLEGFGDHADEASRESWRRQLNAIASRRVAAWLQANRMELVGMSSLSFE